MPHDHDVKLSGTITDVFGHRFVVTTDNGKVLADIGPKAGITFRVDDHVEIEGEQKPTEVKVRRMAINRGHPLDAHHGHKHKGKPNDHEPSFSADDARRIAEREGFRIIGGLTAHKNHYAATAEHGESRHEIHVHEDRIVNRHKVR